MNLLEIRPDESSIQKLHDGVELDLGGNAKGFGVDLVALALEKLEITDYMIEVGGEIRIRGKKNDGSPWKLAIEEPSPEARKLHATLSLPPEGAALATSGDYRNFRKVGGRLVSHTFDPRTLEPTPRRTASVSVVRPTAAEADALATALSVLSPTEAIELANEQGWAIYLLVHYTRAATPGTDQPRFVPHASQAFEKISFEPVQ
jgi:thiamine biosynthesis lipoprotein